MKWTIIDWLKRLLIYYIVAFVTMGCWTGLKLLIDGYIKYGLADIIIGIILILSIMLNIMFVKVITKFLNDK